MAPSASASIASISRFSAYYCYSSSTLHLNRINRRPLFSIISTKKQQLLHGCKRMSTSALNKDKVTAPYGSWTSPITSDVVAAASKRLGGTALDSNGLLIWLESRPAEAGYS